MIQKIVIKVWSLRILFILEDIYGQKDKYCSEVVNIFQFVSTKLATSDRQIRT